MPARMAAVTYSWRTLAMITMTGTQPKSNPHTAHGPYARQAVHVRHLEVHKDDGEGFTVVCVGGYCGAGAPDVPSEKASPDARVDHMQLVAGLAQLANQHLLVDEVILDGEYVQDILILLVHFVLAAVRVRRSPVRVSSPGSVVGLSFVTFHLLTTPLGLALVVTQVSPGFPTLALSCRCGVTFCSRPSSHAWLPLNQCQLARTLDAVTAASRICRQWRWRCL